MARYKHNTNSAYSFFNFFNVATSGYLPENQILPKGVVAVDNNTFNLDFWTNSLSGYAVTTVPDAILIQDTPSARWDLNHGLNSKCVITEVFSPNTNVTELPQANVVKNVTFPRITPVLNIPYEASNYFVGASITANTQSASAIDVFYLENVNKKTAQGFYMTLSDDPKDALSINWYSQLYEESDTFKNGKISVFGKRTATVNFNTPFSDTSYNVQLTFEADSSEAGQYAYIITEKTTSGFRILFSDTVKDLDGYISWIAYKSLDENAYSSFSTLASGIHEMQITLPEVMESSDYGISYVIENLTDSNPIFFLSHITTKTTTYFIVRFSTTLPTSNYRISWVARKPATFLSNSEIMSPYSIEIVDENNVQVFWNAPKIGIASFKKVGNIVSEKDRYPIPYGNGNVFSPHYRVEVDLNTEPISPSENAIITRDIETSLYEECEKFRPLSRVAHYEIKFLIEGLVYGQTKTIRHYSDIINPNWYHSSTFSAKSLSNNDVKVLGNIVTASKIWTLPHNFGTNSLYCQCVDLSLKPLKPKSIKFNYNKEIVVEFGQAVRGYLLVKKADHDVPYNFTANTNLLYNSYNSSDLLVQLDPLFKTAALYPDSLKVDEDFININFANIEKHGSLLCGRALIVQADYVHTQDTEALSWTVQHNSGYKVHLFQVVDENGNYIEPYNVEFLDINLLKVYFKTAKAGKVFLCYVPEPSTAEDIFYEKARNGKIEIRLSNTKQDLLTVKTRNDLIDKVGTYPVTKISYDENYYYYEFHIPQEKNFEIRSWGIFDSEDVGTQLYFFSTGELIAKVRGFYTNIIYKVERR